MQAQTYSAQRTQPSRWEIFLHVGKTFKLISAMMFDGRVALWRKLFFVGSIVGLLVVLSTVFPIIGTLAGVPLDAGFDWVAFALVALNLFRFFPAELLAEHYKRIFG